MAVLGFDVFGTLIDPAPMAGRLDQELGQAGRTVLAEWRRTQLEYVFRRAAMGRYQPFDRVTRAALDRAVALAGLDPDEETREDLVAAWTTLPAFADAPEALGRLNRAGHRCVACSNGTPDGLRALLDGAGLAAHLDDILSVDAVGLYKPAAAVYNELVARGGEGPEATWLVSGNPWDVIGARSAGLHAAWVRREPGAFFDVWEESPDCTVADLGELVERAPFSGG